MAFFSRILDWLFFCRHKHLSFPQSKPGKPITVSCLDCGRVFLYDWKQMKVIEG